LVARQHLLRNDRAGLFLDMGLGKTATTLCALEERHLPALVIAPKRVAEEVWEVEGNKWRPDLKVMVAAGSPRARDAALTSGADVVAIGRDNAADAVFRSSEFRTLILDELSSFKSPSSQRFKAAKKIAADPAIQHVWGLTGTPAPNGYLDLWSQVFLLDGGERLGRTLTQYRSRYFTPGYQLPNGVITEWLLRPGAAGRINQLLEDLCLSMATEGRVTLPPVTLNKVDVTLPPAARQLYRTLKDDLVADLGVLGLGANTITADTAAALSNKLSQVSAGFLYHDGHTDDSEYTVIHREKVRAVEEILDGTGSPTLLLYRYRPEAEMLRGALGDRVHTVDEPGVFKRWDAGEIPVLLAHPASIGHGLNLQHGGYTAIWSSLPWSLEEWEQTNKRLARQGQQHPVVIHLLMAGRTLDPAILKALEGKTSVQAALLDHLESPL
jgi:hypothetical protein